MNSLKSQCRCECGAEEFEVRLHREEQVGLLTCVAGHHSLLLDSRDYWADVLQEGKPKRLRCECRNNQFRVSLHYEFRQTGDVRTIRIKLTCNVCTSEQAHIEFEFKYSPTDHLLARPLDPIDHPWRQPKRHQITSLWKPADAERFATYLTETLGARLLSEKTPYQFTPATLADIPFYPELKQDLLFTNVAPADLVQLRDPENILPFIRLNRPLHMMYFLPQVSNWTEHVRLLHYIRYSQEVVRNGAIEKQQDSFLSFAEQARDWLRRNFISLRGRNTADNPDEFEKFQQGRGKS